VLETDKQQNNNSFAILKEKQNSGQRWLNGMRQRSSFFSKFAYFRTCIFAESFEQTLKAQFFGDRQTHRVREP
jgi:hypothetical protein